MSKFVAKSGFAFVVCATGLLLVTAACADDASCKPVRDAMLATTATKYDANIVITVTGRAPIVSQTIYTLNATYHQVLRRWIKTPTSPARELAGEKNIDAMFTECRRLRDGTLSREPVAIYTAKTNNRTLVSFASDLKLWISVKRGVPLRSEANTAIPILGPSHTVKIYAYDNVRPPPI